MKKPFINKVLFFIQRHSFNIYLRNTINLIVSQFLPKSKKQLSGSNYLNIEKSEEQILNDLKKLGYSDLGISLSDSSIEIIKSRLVDLPCYKFDKNHKSVVDFQNISNDFQLGNYDRNDLSGISEILSIANDSKILNVTSKYLKVTPTISNINCWWSFAQRDTPKEAQFFHRDLDDFKFLKLFVYLTDVDSDSGPHIYVKGSHKSNKLNSLKRFKDEEVVKQYLDENIISFERLKGSCFIVDTYGIHKGLLPKNGNRLLLQVQYSYLPLHVENYNPVLIGDYPQKIFDKYINRLIINTN
jgi:hypothetical protein